MEVVEKFFMFHIFHLLQISPDYFREEIHFLIQIQK